MDAWKYEPAHDVELPPFQRWRSIRREDGLAERIAHGMWWSLVCSVLTLGHRLRVTGREHLPSQAPFVVIANHSSHLDALVLAAALPRRLRRVALPVAAGDTFFETPAVAAFAAWALNALPLWRKNAGRHAMEQLRERLLAEPCGYILFPEGTRSRTGEMGAFKAGLGMIVAGAAVPVVPCYLSGAHDAWPPGARRPRLKRISVHIGPALHFENVANGRLGWEQVARESEAAVRTLKHP